MVPEAVLVKAPLLATVMPPVPFAVQAAPRMMLAAVKLMPDEPLVVMAPLNVEVAVPSV